MKNSTPAFIVSLIIAAAFVYPAPLFAEESIEELKIQIEALQKRVEELEAAQLRHQQQSRAPEDMFENRNRNRYYDPFEEMERIRSEMNRMFEHSFDRRQQGFGEMFDDGMAFDADIDFTETKDGYELKLNTKGLNEEKLEVEVNKHSVTIKGEHSLQKKEQGPDRVFHSRSFGTFLKTIPLPMDADTSKVKTEKEGDTLVIRIPKKA